jgi:hypothetical protein
MYVFITGKDIGTDSVKQLILFTSVHSVLASFFAGKNMCAYTTEMMILYNKQISRISSGK